MPDGQRVTSAHGILEVASVLSETFKSKAQELFRSSSANVCDLVLRLSRMYQLAHKHNNCRKEYWQELLSTKVIR